jgi:catechol 2,3-dioxygenase
VASTFTIRRAGHVVLRVTDPGGMKSFLEQVVGFTTVGQEGPLTFLSSHPVSNHHMIAVRNGKAGERLPEPLRHIGMISISYELSSFEELRRLYARISDKGDAFGAKIVRSENYDHVYTVVCSDKDGNWFEFYSEVSDEHADLAASPIVEDADRVSRTPVAIRRTSHLTLRCRDREASQAFYEKALRLYSIADTKGRMFLAGDREAGHPVLALEQAHGSDCPLPAPKEMYGLEHFSLEVGSFAQLQEGYRHLESLGLIHHTMDHGVTNSVYFNDPDGNLMEIYHDVPRAEYKTPESPFAAFGPIDDRLGLGAEGNAERSPRAMR